MRGLPSRGLTACDCGCRACLPAGCGRVVAIGASQRCCSCTAGGCCCCCCCCCCCARGEGSGSSGCCCCGCCCCCLARLLGLKKKSSSRSMSSAAAAAAAAATAAAAAVPGPAGAGASPAGAASAAGGGGGGGGGGTGDGSRAAVPSPMLPSTVPTSSLPSAQRCSAASMACRTCAPDWMLACRCSSAARASSSAWGAVIWRRTCADREGMPLEWNSTSDTAGTAAQRHVVCRKGSCLGAQRKSSLAGCSSRPPG